MFSPANETLTFMELKTIMACGASILYHSQISVFLQINNCYTPIEAHFALMDFLFCTISASSNHVDILMGSILVTRMRTNKSRGTCSSWRNSRYLYGAYWLTAYVPGTSLVSVSHMFSQLVVQ